MYDQTIEQFLEANVKEWNWLTDGMRTAWLNEAYNVIENLRANNESVSYEIGARYSVTGWPVIWVGE